MSVTISNVKKQEIKRAKFDKNNNLVNGPIMSSCTIDITRKLDKEYDETYLCIFTNLLRQVILEYVPTYAYTKDSISISLNNSRFDNDVMREHLSQLPITKINHDVFYLDKKYWKTSINDDIINHKDDTYEIESYVNINNTDKYILNVTTDHLSTFVNKKEVKNMYGEYDPIVLIKLKPNESFQCNMRGILGVPKKCENWCAVSTIFYKYDDESNIVTLKLSSHGQFDEINILFRACEFIKMKSKTLHNYIDDLKNEMNLSTNDEIIFELSFKDDNYTVTYFLNYILQNMKEIKYAGIYKKSYLENDIYIKIISNSHDPFIPIHNAIDIMYNIYDDFQKKLNKFK